MRKTRFLFLALALVLSILAVSPPQASANRCWCEVLCWDYGTQYCWQDSCCNFYCCDKSDPGCWVPCW
jgi:hypothetical protein